MRVPRLCLDSKYEGGKLSALGPLGLLSLCLDSKYEGGKLISTVVNRASALP